MRTISILGLPILAALAASAPAAAATVSPTGVRFPQVAINADGATVVAWERTTRSAFAIEARAGSSPLKLGRTRRLTSRGYQPQVAIGADGTKAVMWMQLGARGTRSLRVAVARPGHRFGRSRLVDRRRANMAPVGLAVAPSGRVVAIWQRSASMLGFALAARRHAFGKPRNLAATGHGATIAVDPRDGAVLVSYGTRPIFAPPSNQRVAVRTLSRSGSAFSAPVLLSAGTGSSFDARPVAISGPGGSGVAFTLLGDPYALGLARRRADGSWAAAERIATASYGEAVFPVGLRATLPSDGSAVAAWTIDSQSSGLGGSVSSRTVASIASPSAPFGMPQALTPTGTRHYGTPAVASAGGEAFVASAEPHGPVILATRSAGASSFARTSLTAAGDGDVLLAAAGRHVVAVYQRGDRLRLTVVR